MWILMQKIENWFRQIATNRSGHQIYCYDYELPLFSFSFYQQFSFKKKESFTQGLLGGLAVEQSALLDSIKFCQKIRQKEGKKRGTREKVRKKRGKEWESQEREDKRENSHEQNGEITGFHPVHGLASRGEVCSFDSIIIIKIIICNIYMGNFQQIQSAVAYYTLSGNRHNHFASPRMAASQ